MQNSGFSLFINVFLPVAVASIYFLMAGFVKKIAPLRSLITGKKTYHYAFFIFLFFGLFLIGRPFQVLLGGHPFPLIISSIREFIMIGLLTPCILLAVLNHLYYDKNMPQSVPYTIISICIMLGVLFVVLNCFCVNGSVEIFKYKFFGMNLTANDGGWFQENNKNAFLIPFLFLIRLIDPVLMIIGAGILSFWESIEFPKDSLYTNLPKKYMIQALALFLFAGAMLFTGFMVIFWGIQSQWYYAGALLAGVVELYGLRMPARSIAIKNEMK